MIKNNASPPDKNSSKEVTADNFWQTDLEDVEAVFLGEGDKITDLPLTPVGVV